MGICQGCFDKQRQIDLLKQEVESLRRKLRYRTQQQQEGFFGSSTPSAKRPVKPNAETPAEAKPKGARRGHKGGGRPTFEEGEADSVVDVPVLTTCCPHCGSEELSDYVADSRSLLESAPVKAKRVVQKLHGKRCARCGHRVVAKAKGVLPKNLLGNQVLTNAAVMHYEHGIPMARVAEQLGLNEGTLVQALQRLARLLARVPEQLVLEYRKAPAKHADETPWRTSGQNGYAWLFATEALSLFYYRETRSAVVPRAVFGDQPLDGVLVVDRYAAYNKVPCRIQYCLAHLLREVQDLEKEKPDSPEVRTFVSTLASLLATAMALRNQPISDDEYYRRAAELERLIRGTAEAPAKDFGIRRIQDIFRDNEERLYHWVRDRRVPAENNRAERDLRPTVIARKVSFGSQSPQGAQTRSILTSVLHTMRKRGIDTVTSLCEALGTLAENIDQDPYPLLFRTPAPGVSTQDPPASPQPE